MANLLVVILHDTDRLGALLDAWDEVGVPGVTIFSSIGGYQARSWLQKLGLGGLAQIFDSNEVDQRTLLSLIDNDQLLEKAISTADHIVKGFDRPKSGILFTLPVGKILGLQKWGSKKDTNRKDGTVIDSLHRTKELGYRVKEALEIGDLEKFGLLLHEHWENKKRRSGKISNPDIDRWYELAREKGAVGGKIMGAGGGGFFMFYCPNSSKKAVRKAMAAEGLRELIYDFDFEGTKVLVNF